MPAATLSKDADRGTTTSRFSDYHNTFQSRERTTSATHLHSTLTTSAPHVSPTTPTTTSHTSTSPLYSPPATGLARDPPQPSASTVQTGPSQIPAGARNAIVIASTIGGVLVLAFLVYALWRRRQGATYAEIVRFRRHSSTIYLGSSYDERLTALPIYREQRYSVRSSKPGSTNGRHLRKAPGVPSPIAARFHQQQPWLQSAWKSGSPSVPASPKHPLSQATPVDTPEEIKPPEMARIRIHRDIPEEEPEIKPITTSASDKPSPVITVRQGPFLEDADEGDDDHGPRSPTSPQEQQRPQDRWSWTNSQAPPTPKYASSFRSSWSTLPRFRKVKSWARNQADRNAARISEERMLRSNGSGSGSGKIPELPALKNKASKPNLAPPPARKLSKKSPRERSKSVLLEAYGDGSGEEPSVPEMARVRGRGGSA